LKIFDKFTFCFFSCFVLHFAAYALVIVNLPLIANVEATDDLPMVLEKTNRNLVIVTAFLLGLGDAGVNNVIYTTISSVWHEDSAPAFALMKELSFNGTGVFYRKYSIFCLKIIILFIWKNTIR